MGWNKSSEPSSFGILLRQHRLAAGMSQEKLAEQAGLSRRGIADLERGARRLPHPETIHLLSDALKLQPSHRSEFIAAGRNARGTAADSSGPQNHLPMPLSRFIGRQEQIAEIHRRLINSRL